jgi:hypothetical protein
MFWVLVIFAEVLGLSVGFAGCTYVLRIRRRMRDARLQQLYPERVWLREKQPKSSARRYRGF